ncbi:10 kDa heat shock protein [Irineochytrium annulatum]|nr:10 kDa heat shock protein [Irineochytrium annulatum]
MIPLQKTASGILIPEKAQEALNEGTVMEVGPGRTDSTGALIAPVLKKGDRVLLPAYSGTAVKINNVEMQLFEERDIVAKVE